MVSGENARRRRGLPVCRHIDGVAHMRGRPHGAVFGVELSEVSGRGSALIAEYVARMLERGRGT